MQASVGVLAKEEAIDLYKKGQTLQQIAEQAGVTRERIRQVLAKVGLSAESPVRQQLREARRRERRERRQAQSTLRESRRAEKQRLHDEHVKRLSELWRSGHTLKEMGVLLGLSQESIGQKIVYFRTYEPELFPRRHRAYNTMPVTRQLRHLWVAGKTIEEIAQKFSLTYHQVRGWLDRARQQYGIEAFPYHFQVRDDYSQRPDELDAEYTERLRKLLRPLRPWWAEWMSIKDLASIINVPQKRIYSLVIVARSRFGWFPIRDSAKRDEFLRRQLRTELKEANELWKKGISGAVIARKLGMSLKRFYNRVDDARRVMGKSWFERRVPTKEDRERSCFLSAPCGKAGCRRKT